MLQTHSNVGVSSFPLEAVSCLIVGRRCHSWEGSWFTGTHWKCAYVTTESLKYILGALRPFLASQQLPVLFIFARWHRAVTPHLFLCYRVMVKDPFHANCLPVHIGTLVELGKSNGRSLMPSELRVVGYWLFIAVLHCFIVLHLILCSVFSTPRVVLPLAQTCGLVSQQSSKCVLTQPDIWLNVIFKAWQLIRKLLIRCPGLQSGATI